MIKPEGVISQAKALRQVPALLFLPGVAQRLFLLFFSFFALWSLPGAAHVLCESFYHPRPAAEALQAKLGKAQAFRLKAQIKELAEKLILQNADAMMNSPHGRSVLFEYDFRGGRIHDLQWAESPAGSYTVLNVTWINSLGDQTVVPVRTNGQVAFLDRSYRFREPRKAKKFVAAFLKDSKIEFVDQGLLVLESLPAKVQLSRSLSAKEKEIWIQGGIPQSGFGPKLHFGLNEYWYRGEKPALFRIEKTWLLEAYRAGHLEINTYDSTGAYAAGEKARTAFGLEVELVLVGQPALEQIAPLMKSQLLKPPAKL